MGIRVGMCGVGSFARNFIPLFKHHPDVDQVILCDLDAEKLAEKSAKFDIPDTCPSLDELCQTEVDAIVIITQHHLHGPQAVQALEAGKHVYSAVPSAMTIAEMKNLVHTVEKTGKIYMVGETSYYYPCAIYCRQRFQQGDFGDVVYAEGEYFHDYSHGMIPVLQWRHGEDWERYANWPPMFYPTHSMSLIVSVTGAHATHVTGLGFEDRDPDRLFHGTDQVYNNHFSNEVALCRMSDGSIARISEFRRIGHPGNVGMSMYGTQGSYEEHRGSHMWETKDKDARIDLTARLQCEGVRAEGNMAQVTGTDGTHLGVSAVHPVERLPKAFVGLSNGHKGSHQFLVHDFVTACLSGKQPPNNVWDAARYLIPGLIAHESALQGGVQLEVPDFGDAPKRTAR